MRYTGIGITLKTNLISFCGDFDGATMVKISNVLDRVVGILSMPFRSALLHLILVGTPLRFGLLPTTWCRDWPVVERFLSPSVDMFDVKTRPEDEGVAEFSIMDAGVRFIYFYELAVVVCVLLARSNIALLSFHKLLLLTSFGTILLFSCIQKYSPRYPHLLNTTILDPALFASLVFYHMIAIAFSVLTIVRHSAEAPLQPPPTPVETPNRPSTLKWSIPANSVFYALLVNGLVVIATCQALYHDHLALYIRHDEQVASLLRTTVIMGAFYTLLHAILLPLPMLEVRCA